MKKLNKVLTFGLSLALLTACGAKASNSSKFGKITDGKDYIAKNDSGKKTDTLQDLYESLYDNEEVFNLVLAEIAKAELGLSYNTTTHTWTDGTEDDYDYAAIIDERRVEYLNKTTTEYKSTDATDGIVSIFDEESFVETLRKNGYTVDCSNGYGPVLNNDWTYDEDKKYLCDYTNLYEKTLDAQILIDLLTEHYVLTESVSDITKANVRKVKYLEVSTGNYSTVTGTGEEKKLVDTNNASDFVYDVVLKGLKNNETLESFEETWKQYQLDTIDFKAEDACSYETNSSYTECSTYTDNSTISIEDGVKREKLKVLNSEYYFEKVLTNANTSMFNDAINSYLFSDKTASRLKTVGGNSYLVSTAISAGATSFDDQNIVITDKTNSKYLFMDVTIIDENTEDKALLLEAANAVILADTELFEEAITYYLNEYKVTVHTSSFEEWLEQNYPSVKFRY